MIKDAAVLPVVDFREHFHVTSFMMSVHTTTDQSRQL